MLDCASENSKDDLKGHDWRMSSATYDGDGPFCGLT